MSTLNLTKVSDILDEVTEYVEDLDGRSHDDAACSRRKSTERDERAAVSRQLNLIADRLEMAAALTRSEYWTARGFTDHINNED